MLFNILLLIIAFILAYMYWRLHKQYQALDKGMTDVAEAYYSDSLQYEESLMHLREDLAQNNRDWQAGSDRQFNNLNGKIQRRNETIDNLTRENAGLRKQLDIAQRIILEIDAARLPDLKEMSETTRELSEETARLLARE